MNLFGVLDLAGGALTAERRRAEVVAANLANAETTRTPEGGPYVRKHVVFTATAPSRFGRLLNAIGNRGIQAVRISDVVPSNEDPVLRYQPGHPDANAEGMVAYPAINPVQEMVDLMGAVRSYQLNAAAAQGAKNMIQQSLEILR